MVRLFNGFTLLYDERSNSPTVLLAPYDTFAISLQRYLTRRRLHSPFSVRQKGAVVALLDPGHQLEDVRNHQGFGRQHHL
jgi:hypothetical protein